MGVFVKRHCASRQTLSRAAPASKNERAISPPVPLFVRGPLCRARRGTRKAQPGYALPQQTREIRVVPCLMRRFGEVSDHNGEGLRPLRERLGALQDRAMLDRHLPVGTVAAHRTASV